MTTASPPDPDDSRRGPDPKGSGKSTPDGEPPLDRSSDMATSPRRGGSKIRWGWAAATATVFAIIAGIQGCNPDDERTPPRDGRSPGTSDSPPGPNEGPATLDPKPSPGSPDFHPPVWNSFESEDIEVRARLRQDYNSNRCFIDAKVTVPSKSGTTVDTNQITVELVSGDTTVVVNDGLYSAPVLGEANPYTEHAVVKLIDLPTTETDPEGDIILLRFYVNGNYAGGLDAVRIQDSLHAYREGLSTPTSTPVCGQISL